MTERAAFEAFARRAVDPLRAYLRRRVDAATADDVLGETLLVCWRRRADLPPGDEAVPWAFGVARGCLRNAARSTRRQERLAARVASVDPPRPIAGPESVDDDPGLSQALAGLREKDAEIVRLWAWEELGPAEIAGVLGMTANAVSIRLHRVKKRLAEQLRKTDADDGHDQVKGGER